jgi:hypothetical protein
MRRIEPDPAEPQAVEVTAFSIDEAEKEEK